MSNTPILSICIPVYNRKMYLQRTLERLLCDKELFLEDIQLYISDNCSEDDILSVCEKYKEQGLNMEYHRNAENLNMDGNFANCFRHAKGKYVLLLGSDDTPNSAFFSKVLPILRNNDLGLLHLSINSSKDTLPVFYDNHESFLVDINCWITFISGNIVATKYVEKVDLDRFKGTFLTQVPVYLEAACNSGKNAVLSGSFYLRDNDSSNNGGYGLFRVFVENLFSMYQQSIDKGMLSQNAFELIKECEYKTWLVGFVVELLILKRGKRKNFDQTNAWSILRKHYGGYSYFYYVTLFYTLKSVAISVVRPVFLLVKRR